MNLCVFWDTLDYICKNIKVHSTNILYNDSSPASRKPHSSLFLVMCSSDASPMNSCWILGSTLIIAATWCKVFVQWRIPSLEVHNLLIFANCRLIPSRYFDTTLFTACRKEEKQNANTWAVLFEIFSQNVDRMYSNRSFNVKIPYRLLFIAVLWYRNEGRFYGSRRSPQKGRENGKKQVIPKIPAQEYCLNYNFSPYSDKSKLQSQKFKDLSAF